MEYYYLVATLPDLLLPEARKDIDVDQVLETINRNLSEQDRKLSEYFFLPADNQNLIHLLRQRKIGSYEFQLQQPSIFSVNELKTGFSHHFTLPNYMAYFLSRVYSRLDEFSSDQLHGILERAFYEEVSKLKNEFIGKYFAFEKLVRSTVLGINNRQYDLALDPEDLNETEFAQFIFNEDSTIAKLIETYGFYDELKEAINSQNPQKIELLIDRIIWDFLEQYPKNTFSREYIFSYIVRLLKVNRWSVLERQASEKHFEKCLERVERQTEITNYD